MCVYYEYMDVSERSFASRLLSSSICVCYVTEKEKENEGEKDSDVKEQNTEGTYQKHTSRPRWNQD